MEYYNNINITRREVHKNSDRIDRRIVKIETEAAEGVVAVNEVTIERVHTVVIYLLYRNELRRRH